ncbi:unnamed protein product [Camellia sinensis]
MKITNLNSDPYLLHSQSPPLSSCLPSFQPHMNPKILASPEIKLWRRPLIKFRKWVQVFPMWHSMFFEVHTMCLNKYIKAFTDMHTMCLNLSSFRCGKRLLTGEIKEMERDVFYVYICVCVHMIKKNGFQKNRFEFIYVN